MTSLRNSCLNKERGGGDDDDDDNSYHYYDNDTDNVIIWIKKLREHLCDEMRKGIIKDAFDDRNNLTSKLNNNYDNYNCDN